MNTPREQGRQRIQFGKLPIDAFMLEKFDRFAKRPEHQASLKRLAIEYDEVAGWPIVGNPQIVPALIRMAVEPERVVEGSEQEQLYLTCLRRVPDFILALSAHLRREVAKLKPAKRAVLFGRDDTKLTDAEKTERHAARLLQKKQQKQREIARERLDALLTRNLNRGGEQFEVIIEDRVSKKKRSKS